MARGAVGAKKSTSPSESASRIRVHFLQQRSSHGSEPFQQRLGKTCGHAGIVDNINELLMYLINPIVERM